MQFSTYNNGIGTSMDHDPNESYGLNSGKKRILLIAGSAVFLFLVSALLGLMKETEIKILIWHNSVYENPAALAWWKWITRYGLNIISFTEGLLVFLSLWNKQLRSLQPALFCALFTYAVGWFAEDALKEWIGRVRPAAELAGQIANTYISDSPSYPSGHATKAMTLVLPFVFLAPKAGLTGRAFNVFLLLVAVLVSYSRIPLQLHYPSDILGGTALACALTLIAIPLVKFIYAKCLKNIQARNYFHIVIGSIFIFLAVIFLLI